MMKGADSPYWKRPQFKTLTSNTWDILIIMLGTNDAKDAGSRGPHNWPHNCTGENALRCPFAVDYNSMVTLVKKQGGVTVFNAIPPPLMQDTVYGMNQTVINTVFPMLIPTIWKANQLDGPGPIDVFSALGGEKNWVHDFNKNGCKIGAGGKCPLFCDEQSCDQCHPDDNGYTEMAKTMMHGIGL